MLERGELRPGGRYAFLVIALFVALGLSAASVLAARPSDSLRGSTRVRTSKSEGDAGAPMQVADVGTPTPTATPELLSVALAPAVAEPGSSITLSYTVYSQNATQVLLGASIQNAGTSEYTTDEENDRTLVIAAGQSVVTRTFQLPLDSNVTYNVAWGLWSGVFGEQYGLIIINGALTTTSAG